MNSFATTYPKDRPRGRCCARCRTPYNCGNPDCRCHPLTVAQLIARAAALGGEDRTVTRISHENPDDFDDVYDRMTGDE